MGQGVTVAVVAVLLVACTPVAPGTAAHEAAPVTGKPPVEPQIAPATNAPSTGDPPASSDRRYARLDGFGPLRLGMTMAEAGQAWPGVFDAPPRLHAGGCFSTALPGDDLPYFTLMFDDGKFVRYETSNDALLAPGGGKRGMDEAALQALYRNALRATPDRFAKGGKLLALDTSGVAPSRLVFVVRPDGKVDEWRVGLSPQVDYDEACESDPG